MEEWSVTGTQRRKSGERVHLSREFQGGAEERGATHWGEEIDEGEVGAVLGLQWMWRTLGSPGQGGEDCSGNYSWEARGGDLAAGPVWVPVPHLAGLAGLLGGVLCRTLYRFHGSCTCGSLTPQVSLQW